jgi:predicted O-methyltransferase YrrM
MEHFWENIDGYLDHFELQDLAVKTFTEGHFVEIGTFKGRSAAYLSVEIINSGKNIKLHTVDHYEQSRDLSADSRENYAEVLNNLEPVKNIVNIINMKSVDAAKLYDDESLEFVYIDASHDYHSVKEDILAWFNKVKIGGIIGGDDYGWEGVKRAVQEIFPEAKPIGMRDSNWYYIKK